MKQFIKKKKIVNSAIYTDMQIVEMQKDKSKILQILERENI